MVKPPVGGGTRDFKWRGWLNPPPPPGLNTGQKSKRKKIPWWISQRQKFPESIKWYNTKNKNITRLGYASTTTNLKIALSTQTNPSLNQATKNKTCQLFLLKIPESKNSDPKNRSIILVTHAENGRGSLIRHLVRRGRWKSSRYY